jgi:hypothetical protein
MKDSPKLSTGRRWWLLVVVVVSLLGIAALAAALPGVLVGPVGGSLAGY